jgi:hypothetical protein
MPTVFGYLRSFKAQSGKQGVSLEEQKEMVRRLARELLGGGPGYYNRRCYITEHQHGRNRGWPVLREMIRRAIDDADINPEDAFIIPTLDGVQSDLSFLNILCGDDCRDAPIIICSAKVATSRLRATRNYWFFSRDGNAEFVEKVENIVRKRHALSESIKAGIREAAERGEPIGAQRRGAHRFTETEHKKGGSVSAKKRRLAANKPYLTWIPEMLKRREAGRSIGQITGWLASKGARTPEGEKLNPMLVWRILKRASAK